MLIELTIMSTDDLNGEIVLINPEEISLVIKQLTNDKDSSQGGIHLIGKTKRVEGSLIRFKNGALQSVQETRDQIKDLVNK